MKRGLVTLLCSILLAAVGFLASGYLAGLRQTDAGVSHQDGNHLHELEWLRREFDLSAAELERVSSLHLEYLPTCESLCEKISANRGNIRRLVLGGRSVTPELEAALREEAALRAECQTAMLRHLYVTAGALPAEKANAYLEMMLPEVMGMTSGTGEQHRGH